VPQAIVVLLGSQTPPDAAGLKFKVHPAGIHSVPPAAAPRAAPKPASAFGAPQSELSSTWAPGGWGMGVRCGDDGGGENGGGGEDGEGGGGGRGVHVPANVQTNTKSAIRRHMSAAPSVRGRPNSCVTTVKKAATSLASFG
jgi:hypothetical protein